jgi:hypothetical protein
MARYALINDASELVENVIEWDGASGWAPPDGYSTVRSDTAQMGDTYAGGVFISNAPPAPPPPPLADVKRDLIASIDGMVAATYSTWTRFQAEYEARREAAQAFQAAGYAGDPGVWVSSYATAAGLTGKQAADNILAQAAALDATLANVGALRMRKYEISAAADAATAQSIANDITAQVSEAIAALA